MKKTKLSSILLLSAAFLLAACNERTPTPAASSKTEPPASSSVVPAGTSSEEPAPSSSSSEPAPSSSSSVDPNPSSSSSEPVPNSSSSVDPTPSSSSSGDTQVTHVFAGTKNGQPLTLTDVKADTDTCLAKFVLNLVKGDQIALLVDELPFPFKTTGSDNLGEEYTVPHDGEYVFWVNEDYVWVDVPEAKVTYTITCNGENLNVASVVPDGWTDKALFTVTCAAGDKIKVFADGVQVGEEYTCQVAGEYKFGINANGEFWKQTPPVPIVKAEIAVDLGTWAAEGEVVFAHSWKDSSKLTEKVVAGKTNVIEGCDGFLLVVMPEGSEDIDWDKKVKQTVNLALGKGVLTYKEGNTFAWVSDDPEPVVVYTIAKNDASLDLASVVPETWNDKAVFTATCKAGDKIKVFADGEQVGSEYECPRDGEYTFGINADGEFWQIAPEAPIVKAEIAVDLGTWAAEGEVVFAYSWKGDDKLTEKVADGKFNVIEGCDGFLLVVMPEGSEDIDWDKKVKQTANLTLQEGSLAYSSESNTIVWVAEAPKEEKVWKTLTFSKGNCGNGSGYTST